MDEQADINPFPAPLAQPEFHSVLLSVEAPPKPKRGRLFAALAAVVLLVGGFVTYLVLADDDSSSQGYSLSAAVSGTQAAENIAYEMKMDMGVLGSIVVEGRFDATNERMAMTIPAKHSAVCWVTVPSMVTGAAAPDNGTETISAGMPARERAMRLPAPKFDQGNGGGAGLFFLDALGGGGRRE